MEQPCCSTPEYRNLRPRSDARVGFRFSLKSHGAFGQIMKRKHFVRRGSIVFFSVLSLSLLATTRGDDKPTVRFATFNVALNRSSAGALTSELQSGKSQQAMDIAEIVQRVRPDVLLLNEVDFDAEHASIQSLMVDYLGVSQNGQPPITFAEYYTAPVNTGLPSGMDLDGNGKTGDPGDCYGYGNFPGQYGMVVLSQFPIEREKIRTFQLFLWKDMPGGLLPTRTPAGDSFYTPAQLAVFRLSSKSHWDVPIRIRSRDIHFLASHPTPPVFDGPEDRNGRRNHDEIRFWADYITPTKSAYICDDKGRTGGLDSQARFVIAGDLNADPNDGDSTDRPMRMLLQHPNVHRQNVPSSEGAVVAATQDAGVNTRQKGDPAADTGNFPDESTGNLRIDYVLPSKTIQVVDAGVYWPLSHQPGGKAVNASDHRLVWVDILP